MERQDRRRRRARSRSATTARAAHVPRRARSRPASRPAPRTRSRARRRSFQRAGRARRRTIRSSAASTSSMPPGLLGRIANVTLCQDGDAAKGTCREASRIGGVTVGAGAGTNPFYITTGARTSPGRTRAAPFGLSIVVPAVAGPFDLGNVNVRSAIFVDRTRRRSESSATRCRRSSQGIPLDVRDVRVNDRPRRLHRQPDELRGRRRSAGTMTSTDGATAEGSDALPGRRVREHCGSRRA